MKSIKINMCVNCECNRGGVQRRRGERQQNEYARCSLIHKEMTAFTQKMQKPNRDYAESQVAFSVFFVLPPVPLKFPSRIRISSLYFVHIRFQEQIEYGWSAREKMIIMRIICIQLICATDRHIREMWLSACILTHTRYAIDFM